MTGTMMAFKATLLAFAYTAHCPTKPLLDAVAMFNIFSAGFYPDYEAQPMVHNCSAGMNADCIATAMLHTCEDGFYADCNKGPMMHTTFAGFCTDYDASALEDISTDMSMYANVSIPTVTLRPTASRAYVRTASDEKN